MSEENRNAAEVQEEEKTAEMNTDNETEQDVSEEVPRETPADADQEETEEADPSGEEASQKEGQESEAGESDGDPEKSEGKARTSFFKKKKDKEKEKLQAQIEDLTDRLKRNLAEFDNFRKRTEKEKASMYVIGAREIVEKILPVVDNFERGLAQAPEGDPFAEGMKMTYKQLLTTLEDLGVKPIEAVGKEFDPALHNAVMHVEDESVGDNVVVEELQKGYTYRDFVVRHSMVKVAN